MKYYNISNIEDKVDLEKYLWLSNHLNENQFSIEDHGYFISSFYVRFTDPKAETLYLLRWGK